MASDVSILITIDEAAKVSFPNNNKRRMFDLANLLKKRSRKSTMKLTDDLTSEAYYSRRQDIHLPLQKSLPLTLHPREAKNTRQIDYRSFESKAAFTRPPSPRADIVTTESRVHTFVNNGWHFPRLYPLHLAAAGFYYRGNGTEIHCHACNLKTDASTWAENEKPDFAHARLAKDCQFVIDNGYNLKLTQQSKDYYRTATTASNSKVNSNTVLSNNKNHVLDETLTNLSPADKQTNTRQTITSGHLDCSEQNKHSFVQEMQTNQSPCKPFDIMFDGFIGLTIDKNREDTQPSTTDHHNEDIKEKITTGRNDAFTAMDAMNSQITQDGLQSYQQEFKYPQFQSQDARYRSFDTWRFTHKQTPIKLSEAGYFYTGENDIVRCFCCDLGLAEWDPKDNPWTEHARHNPKCWFLLSEQGEQFIEDIQQGWKKIYNPKHAAFDDKESRKATFDGWRIDIEQTPDILADAGFFYTGEEDTVRCHYCDGGLRNWEPGDVPWEEHARWFPFCKFVIKMKGREFIEYIKRKSEEKQRLENSTSTSSSSGLPDDIRDSPVVKELKILEIDEENIRYAVTEFRKRKGHSNFTIEALTELIFNRNDQQQINSPFAAKNFVETEKPEEQDPKKIKELNRKLKDKLKCIRCRTNEICMLFVNCGHRQTCEECADLMDFCPICDTRIKKRLKTFLS